MASTSGAKWFFDLVSYSLGSNGQNCYRATVNTNKSLTASDIASSIASERTDLREETILMVTNLVSDKIMEFVCDGNTVVMGEAVFKPAITGVFTGTTGATDSLKHECKVNIQSSVAFKKRLSSVETAFSGYVKEEGGARISLVTDIQTQSTKGIVTRGESIVIEGNKIKCVGQDGVSSGTARFISTESEEATEVTKFAVNKPSKIVLVVPQTLEEGQYVLQIETYYSSPGTFLKSPRVIEYPLKLTVI